MDGLEFRASNLVRQSSKLTGWRVSGFARSSLTPLLPSTSWLFFRRGPAWLPNGDLIKGKKTD
jgi:hypothetical protein